MNDDHYVYITPKTLNWNPAATGDARCGAVGWSLAMNDASPIDSTVFTEDFASASKTLVVYTTDVVKAGIYDFLVTVSYTDYITPVVALTTTFQFEVKECKSDTLDVDASIWLPDDYYVYGD